MLGTPFWICCRIVTIGPLVFLGLLGVTFRLGSRPARLGVNPPDKRSERTQHRATGEATGGRVNPTKPESMSTRLDDNTRDSNASSFARQGQATPEKGVKSNAIFSTITSNTTRGARIGWGTRTGGVTHFDGVGAPDGVGKSSAPPERAGRSAMSSGRSLRAIWKAGPEKKTDSEQVNSCRGRVVVTGGGSCSAHVHSVAVRLFGANVPSSIPILSSGDTTSFCSGGAAADPCQRSPVSRPVLSNQLLKNNSSRYDLVPGTEGVFSVENSAPVFLRVGKRTFGMVVLHANV